MKISKGVIVGFAVTLLWIWGVTIGALVCRGAVNSDWGCQLVGAVFFIPMGLIVFDGGGALKKWLQGLGLSYSFSLGLILMMILEAGAWLGWLIAKRFPKWGRYV